MGAAAIRVGAVDDHPVMLHGLRSMSAGLAERITLTATAATVGGLLEQTTQLDVVLLDLSLRDGSRPRDNVVRLREHGIGVLVYTEGDRRPWMADAIAAGALGIVLKAGPIEEVAAAIEQAHAGQPVLSAEMADLLARDAALRPQLSDREVEVLQYVAQGLADKQVARVLVISEGTVKEYLKRIRAKYADLGRVASSRVDLLRRALEDGYADPGGDRGSTDT